MNDPTYSVRPLQLGTLDIDKSYNTYMQNAGEQITQPILAYLVSGADKQYLVDTGAPDVEYCSQHQRPIQRGKNETLLARLGALGVGPDDLDAVILTHLHWDHAGAVEAVRNVPHYVQAAELRYAISPLKIHQRGYDCPEHREPHVPFWIGPTYRALPDETEIQPGLRVIPTPGHSPGSQTVLVKTNAGTAALTGDAVPLFENWEKRLPNTIHTDLPSYYDSLRLIERSCDYVLPGHEERVLDVERY